MRAVALKNPLGIIRPSARFPIVINTAPNKSNISDIFIQNDESEIFSEFFKSSFEAVEM